MVTPSLDFDANKIANKVLKHTARELSGVMITLAELAPTNTLVLMAQSVVVQDGSKGAALSVVWPCDGVCVGIFANVRYAVGVSTPASNLFLRVRVNGEDDLFMDSTLISRPGFVPLSHFTGIGTNSYRVRRMFSKETYWEVYLDQPAAGANTTVDLCFDYVNSENGLP